MNFFVRKLSKQIFTGAAMALGLSAAFNGRANACTAGQLQASVRADFAMDIETGVVLYAENADTRLSPASVTKQMVALLILEDLRDGKRSWNDPVYLPATPLRGPGTQQNSDPIDWTIRSVPLKTGLYVMLRRSSNRVPQSFETPEFVARMNARAASLGLTNTHYVNATGYPTEEEQRTEGTDVGHYSSAADIAKIAAELHRVFAANFPQEMEEFRTPRGRFTGTNARGQPVDFTVETSVNLLPGARYGLSNVIDGKTGYICRSRHNLSVVATVDGRDEAFVTTGYADKNQRDADMRNRLRNPSPELRRAIAQAGGQASLIYARRVFSGVASLAPLLPEPMPFSRANAVYNQDLKIRPMPDKPASPPFNFPDDKIIAIRQDYLHENELQLAPY